MTWQPLSTCPENTQVLFGWNEGRYWVGHLGGCRGDGSPWFYGKQYHLNDADDNPPTRWCEIPKWSDEVKG